MEEWINEWVYEWMDGCAVVVAEAVHPWSRTASTMLRGAGAPPPRHTQLSSLWAYNIIYPHGWGRPFFDPRPRFHGPRATERVPQLGCEIITILSLSQGFVGRWPTERVFRRLRNRSVDAFFPRANVKTKTFEAEARARNPRPQQ